MVDYKNVSPTHDRASSRWPTLKADLSNDVLLFVNAQSDDRVINLSRVKPWSLFITFGMEEKHVK